MGTKYLYKQVKIRDGRFFSCFCGEHPAAMKASFLESRLELEYKAGEITTEHPDSPQGIWCKPSYKVACIDAASFQDMWNDGGVCRDSAVLRCLPIGEYDIGYRPHAVKVVKVVRIFRRQTDVGIN